MTELPIGVEVELAPGFDHLYNPDPTQGVFMGAFVGARAKIRDRKNDEVGFPQVFIEWDKDDWRYAGIPDGWTFENHFRVVEQAPWKKTYTNETLLSEMLQKAQRAKTCPNCGLDHEAEASKDYIEELQEATDEILASDGYFIITVREIESDAPGYAQFDGKVFQAEMSEEASIVLEEQLLKIAAQLAVNRRQR